MSTTVNFSAYTIPEMDFGFANIYTIPVPQSQYASGVQTVTPVALKTISFTVSDKNGTIPLANIAVNDVDTAIADQNGKVTLPNIPSNATIKVSYVGYGDYTFSADSVPSKIILNEEATPLDQLNIYTKKKSSNAWLWILAGLGTAYVLYDSTKSGAKTVKAKI